MFTKVVDNKRSKKDTSATLFLFTALVSLLVAGCSTGDVEARFHRVSDDTPAVEGTAEIRETNLGRTAVEVELSGLPEPGLLLDSSSGVYLLWAEPYAGGAELLGQLEQNDNDTWELVAASRLEHLRLFITAEPESDAAAPSVLRIATTGLIDVK